MKITHKLLSLLLILVLIPLPLNGNAAVNSTVDQLESAPVPDKPATPETPQAPVPNAGTPEESLPSLNWLQAPAIEAVATPAPSAAGSPATTTVSTSPVSGPASVQEQTENSDEEIPTSLDEEQTVEKLGEPVIEPLTKEEKEKLANKVNELYQYTLGQAYVTDLWKDVNTELDKGSDANMANIETARIHVQDKLAKLQEYEEQMLEAVKALGKPLEVRLEETRQYLLRRIGTKGKLDWKVIYDGDEIVRVDWSIDFSVRPNGRAITLAQRFTRNQQNALIGDADRKITRDLSGDGIIDSWPLDQLVSAGDNARKALEIFEKVREEIQKNDKNFLIFLQYQHKELTDEMEKTFTCLQDVSKCAGSNNAIKKTTQDDLKKTGLEALKRNKEQFEQLLKAEAFIVNHEVDSEFKISATSSQLISSGNATEQLAGSGILEDPSRYNQENVDGLKKSATDGWGTDEGLEYQKFLHSYLFDFLAAYFHQQENSYASLEGGSSLSFISAETPSETVASNHLAVETTSTVQPVMTSGNTIGSIFSLLVSGVNGLSSAISSALRTSVATESSPSPLAEVSAEKVDSVEEPPASVAETPLEEGPSPKVEPLTPEERKEILDKLEALSHYINVESAHILTEWAEVSKELDKGDEADFANITNQMEYVQMKAALLEQYEKETLDLAEKLGKPREQRLEELKKDILARLGTKGTLQWEPIYEEDELVWVEASLDFSSSKDSPIKDRLKKYLADQIELEFSLEGSLDSWPGDLLDAKAPIREAADTLRKTRRTMNENKEHVITYLYQQIEALTDQQEEIYNCLKNAKLCEGDDDKEKKENQRGLSRNDTEILKQARDKFAEYVKAQNFFFRDEKGDDFLIKTASVPEIRANADMYFLSTSLGSENQQQINSSLEDESNDQRNFELARQMAEKNSDNREGLQYQAFAFSYIYNLLQDYFTANQYSVSQESNGSTQTATINAAPATNIAVNTPESSAVVTALASNTTATTISNVSFFSDRVPAEDSKTSASLSRRPDKDISLIALEESEKLGSPITEEFTREELEDQLLDLLKKIPNVKDTLSAWQGVSDKLSGSYGVSDKMTAMEETLSGLVEIQDKAMTAIFNLGRERSLGSARSRIEQMLKLIEPEHEGIEGLTSYGDFKYTYTKDSYGNLTLSSWSIEWKLDKNENPYLAAAKREAIQDFAEDEIKKAHTLQASLSSLDPTERLNPDYLLKLLGEISLGLQKDKTGVQHYLERLMTSVLNDMEDLGSCLNDPAMGCKGENAEERKTAYARAKNPQTLAAIQERMNRLLALENFIFPGGGAARYGSWAHAVPPGPDAALFISDQQDVRVKGWAYRQEGIDEARKKMKDEPLEKRLDILKELIRNLSDVMDQQLYQEEKSTI